MKIVVKFGGTSLATVKDIKNVVETVDKISKKNKTVVVCSAVDDITDQLIQISSLVKSILSEFNLRSFRLITFL